MKKLIVMSVLVMGMWVGRAAVTNNVVALPANLVWTANPEVDIESYIVEVRQGTNVVGRVNVGKAVSVPLTSLLPVWSPAVQYGLSVQARNLAGLVSDPSATLLVWVAVKPSVVVGVQTTSTVQVITP